MKMRVFRVIMLRDGPTTKEDGKTCTEIVNEEYLYAAETIQQVWMEAEKLRERLGHEITSIAEVAPAIFMLKGE